MDVAHFLMGFGIGLLAAFPTAFVIAISAKADDWQRLGPLPNRAIDTEARDVPQIEGRR